jgi:hypothetical protein
MRLYALWDIRQNVAGAVLANALRAASFSSSLSDNISETHNFPHSASLQADRSGLLWGHSKGAARAAKPRRTHFSLEI